MLFRTLLALIITCLLAACGNDNDNHQTNAEDIKTAFYATNSILHYGWKSTAPDDLSRTPTEYDIYLNSDVVSIFYYGYNNFYQLAGLSTNITFGQTSTGHNVMLARCVEDENSTYAKTSLLIDGAYVHQFQYDSPSPMDYILDVREIDDKHLVVLTNDTSAPDPFYTSRWFLVSTTMYHDDEHGQYWHFHVTDMGSTPL